MYHPDRLSTYCFLRLCPWKWLPQWEWWAEYIFQGQGRGLEDSNYLGQPMVTSFQWPSPPKCSSCLWALLSKDKMPVAMAAILQWWGGWSKTKASQDSRILMSLLSDWINDYIWTPCEKAFYIPLCILMFPVTYSQNQLSSIDINLVAAFIGFLEIVWLLHTFDIRATLIYATVVLLSSPYLMIKLLLWDVLRNMLQLFWETFVALSERSLYHVRKWHKSFDNFMPSFDKVS